VHALAVLVLVIGCGGSPMPSAIPKERATALPPLELRLLAGGTWSSRASMGRVIVIDFWATYCKPCKKAFPKLDRLAASSADVDVIGVAVDDADADVHAFLRETPARFTIARATEQSVQSAPLAITTLPTVIIVDRLGRVRLRLQAQTEADYDSLPRIVADLVADRSAPGD
jgi:thiol-disulfide isomerase/thioredoxin